ncbi:hypothetical protein ME763_00010 [Streptomyces murinus]|uniref:hypothetical protein n=1 Tax=Streptomyces murinus TaxID=33900 RepID=UPI002378D049|nr:hypothetical protein [Streptomyces murinus]WDO04168.1 hypothetical protein ME763_00010 [Streptomyces murinus]
MVTLVTVTAGGAEAEGAEDGVVPVPAFEEPRLGPGDAAALVGLPPLPAWAGSAALSPPKTLTAPTLNAATPAAILNGSPHLRTSEVCSSS